MPTVSVACKIPNGIVMQMGEKKVVLHGSNVAIDKTNFILSPHLAPNGFGITNNVDEDFFKAWMAEHKTLEAVKNGLIFAASKSNDTIAQTKDRKDIKTGLERIDPNKPAKDIEPIKPVEVMS